MESVGAGRRRAGTVGSFDEYVGLGEVVDADGEVYLFHCIGIADGTRTIDVGATVEFTLVRRFGRLEATDLVRR